MTNKEIIAYEVMDIVELLRAGWDECCQDDLDTAANLIESLRREVENLTSQLAEREREREEIKFSQVAFDEVVRIGKDLSEQLATVMKECDEYRVNYKATKVQLENANETLATVTAERDAAYKTVDENWVSHQLVVSLRELLKNRTRERDELAALNARMLVEYEARMKELDELVETLKYFSEYGYGRDICIAALAKVGADKMGEK